MQIFCIQLIGLIGILQCKSRSISEELANQQCFYTIHLVIASIYTVLLSYPIMYDLESLDLH